MDAGYLTTYGDVRELAETMNALLGSDPILVKEKVENGKRYIRENLSLESQIPKYENLYREVIG
jgi:glycosyltransferase involved in cell wall biosynthesis